MKLTIIGGSHGTGALLAQSALAKGHTVTVVSRSGSAPESAQVVKGSATDLDVVSQAVQGADAVAITVGGAKGVKHQRAEVTKTVVEAMQSAGVRRLVVQSSLGAGDSAQLLPPLLRLITPLILAKPLEDHNAQEEIVHNSGLDWTVVRPAGLKDNEPQGTWKTLEVGEGDTLKGSISRGDLAAYMVSILESAETFRKNIGISSS